MLWNVHGLNSTLHVLESECHQHDILLLTETWTYPDMPAAEIPRYSCISSSRASMHAHAFRPSGGIACYLKDEIASRFELWRVSLAGSILWLKSKQTYMQHSVEGHLYIGLAYIAPKGSTFERCHDGLSPFDILQHDIAEASASGGFILLAGDLNAHTGCASEAHGEQDFSDILDASLLPDPASRSLPPRKSADLKICPFGKALLNLCDASDLCILNGRIAGDEAGKFTCCTAQGSSVVDYFIASAPLTAVIPSMIVGDLCAESDHCPLSLRLVLQGPPIVTSIGRPPDQLLNSSVNLQKIKYDASKIDEYRETLSSLIAPVFTAPDPQCCLATALQSCIAKAALASFGRPSKHPSHKVHQKWYDTECKNARAALRDTVAEMPDHAAKMRSYKQLLRRKRRAWQRQAQQDLCELASRKPQAFWRRYNERQSQQCDITQEDWKASFETLYKAPEKQRNAPTSSSSASPANPVIPTQPSPFPPRLLLPKKAKSASVIS